jgi:hypothetical protein
MIAVLLGLLWFAPPAVEVALPRPSELSAVAGDPVELERLAARLGGTRVLQLWSESVARGQARPAVLWLRGLNLVAAQHPERTCQLLPLFLEAALQLGRTRKLDEATTRGIADTLIRMGDSIGQAHFAGEFFGPPRSADLVPELTDLSRRLLGVAYDAALPTPWREAALTALASLPLPSWAPLAPRLLSLVQKPDSAALQRPALAALAILAIHEGSPLLPDLVLNSPDPSLASIAAGELCLLAPPPPRRTPPAAATQVLPPPLAGRVRALAAVDSPPAARQRLGECLRLLGTPQDRALWQAIQTAAKRPHR